MNAIEIMKQLKYPKEFRIFHVESEIEPLKQMETLIKDLSNKLDQPPEPEINNEANKEFLAELSVGAWRLKKKMTNPENQQPFAEMSKAYRHLDSILLTLKKKDIEILDHDGQKFDAGLSLKVLAYQPTPELENEYILETIKPTIYLLGERILMGEVIVATFNKQST